MLKDRIMNKHIRGTFRAAPMDEKMRESHLRWFGYKLETKNNPSYEKLKGCK